MKKKHNIGDLDIQNSTNKTQDASENHYKRIKREEKEEKENNKENENGAEETRKFIEELDKNKKKK